MLFIKQSKKECVARSFRYSSPSPRDVPGHGGARSVNTGPSRFLLFFVCPCPPGDTNQLGHRRELSDCLPWKSVVNLIPCLDHLCGTSALDKQVFVLTNDLNRVPSSPERRILFIDSTDVQDSKFRGYRTKLKNIQDLVNYVQQTRLQASMCIAAIQTRK